METIYKYANRKLYSTHKNSYIDFEYVKNLVLLNKNFIIIDSYTKQDITTDVLKRTLPSLNLDLKLIKEMIVNNA